MSRRLRTERARVPGRRPWTLLFTAFGLAGLGLAGCQDNPLPSEPEGGADVAAGPDLGAAAQTAGAAAIGLDDWIVVFKDGTADPPGLARRLVAANGGTIRFTYRHALRGFAGNLPPQAIEAIQRNPNVDFVERDGPVYKTAVGSWGLDRIDQRYLPLDGIYDPGGARDGSGVTAYIIDSGIDFGRNVDEFEGRASSGPDFIDNDADASDCDGHGTHVAGTVGSKTFGVAKNVNLVAVRVLGCQGTGSYSQVIAGIDWVEANHVSPAVANMSLGGGFSQSLNNAVDNAVGAGVTFVVSAGNDNADACGKSPASAASAVTVGSTTSSDGRSSFSNYGTCVDIFAPGSGITSTIMGGGSQTWSGTSMASPHVAGVAALLLQDDGSRSPAAVTSALIDAATRDVISNPGSGSPNLLLYARTDSGDPCAGGACPTVEVQWVSGVTKKTNKGKRASGTVTVQVVEVGGDPVAGVTVNGSWTVNGTPDYTTSSGPTGADGTVELTTGMIRHATSFDFCVTSLTGSVVDGTPEQRCSPYGAPAGGVEPAPSPANLQGSSTRKGKNWKANLIWEGGAAAVDVYRDGSLRAPGVGNAGSYTDNVGKNPPPHVYRVCNAGTGYGGDCTNDATVTFP